MTTVLVLVGVPERCQVDDLPMVTARIGYVAPDDVHTLPLDCTIESIMEALNSQASMTSVLYVCNRSGVSCMQWPLQRVSLPELSETLKAQAKGRVHVLVDAVMEPDEMEEQWPVLVDWLSGMIFNNRPGQQASQALITLAYYRRPTECETIMCTRFRGADLDEYSVPPSQQQNRHHIVCETLASSVEAAKLVTTAGVEVQSFV
tara:strand:+ start:773 stop:1384 length:612 start_codon:yes stop_codon:yes gene_type:complete